MSLETLDFDHNVFNQSQRDSDAALAVRFYTMPIQNDVQTVEQGRPIFDDTEMVEIRVRGDRNNVVQRPVREDDKRRFRDAYRDYKDGIAKMESGTPLREWPSMSASMVEELKYLGFFTVEQLAQANDAACSRVPGLTTMKQRAQAFIEFSKGTAPLDKMSKELQDMKARAEAAESSAQDMARRMDQMQQQMNSLVTAQAAAQEEKKMLPQDQVVTSPAAKTQAVQRR